MDPLVQFLMDAVGKLGAAAGPIFFAMWYLADKERRQYRDEKDALLERALKAMESGTQSITRLADMLGARHDP